MEIRPLDKETYAGRKFTARYTTSGYYDIAVSEGGFAMQYTPFEAPLERVNLEPYLDGVELVVAGGESDRDARPLDYEWVLDIREQCIRKQVNFEFRQCGTHFIKDGRQYKLQTRDLCRQARLAGINYQCEPSRDNKRESSYA